MHIAIAGPTDLMELSSYLPEADVRSAPKVYKFPYLARLAIEYRRAGHQVSVLTQSDEISADVKLCGDGIDVFISPRRGRARERALDMFAAERVGIERSIQRAQPNVVHAHWLYEFAAGSLSSHERVLVTAHDDPLTLIRYYRHPYWLLRARLGMSVLRRAEHLTAVSPSLLGSLRLFRAERRPIAVIPNGIVEEVELVSPHRHLDRFLVIANGFDNRKNSAAAIRAFSAYRRMRPQATLSLIGVGHEEQGPAHAWATRRNLAQNVSFLGLVDAQVVSAALEASDVVLHPSRWEACSLAILESQAHGAVVIGDRRSGGVAYTLDGGRAGILTDFRCAKEVALAMDSTRDPTMRLRLVREAESRLRSVYNLSDVGRRYRELLAEL